MEYVEDKRGNRCSISYFGSEEAAKAALASLSNCSNCSYCRIFGPTRSDGYTFYLNHNNQIRAGCRTFLTFAAARDHWIKTRSGTKLGIESLAILDALEAISKLET